MNLNEWVKHYIKEVTHSHEYEDMSQMGEDENDPQEIKVGNYQTKYFHVCPGASALYKDIESKGVDMDMAERSARLQDALYFVEEHIQRDGYKPERDYAMVANNLAKNIMKLASIMNLTDEHSYIQGHVDTIESIVKQKGLEERIMELTEENVPTDPAKWSYYKSQAKEKFDVYPSAYANAWAAKQYKDAGGGWRTKKSESVNESADYKYLTQIILDAKPKYDVYYNSSHNVVNIGGVGYDKGDLVKNFNQTPGSSSKIKNNFYHAHQDPQKTKREVEKLSKGKIKVKVGDRGFLSYSVNESVNEEKVYIDFLNKKKGFKQDRIRFNSYEDAVKWAKKNFEKFNPDMIHYESVNEATKYKVGQKTPVGKIVGTSVWGKGREQEWFYDIQKPGYSPVQYSEKSLDKIMGESVNDGWGNFLKAFSSARAKEYELEDVFKKMAMASKNKLDFRKKVRAWDTDGVIKKDANGDKWIDARYERAMKPKAVKEATPEEEDEFHTKLDKLVHKTFGHSSDEEKMNEAKDMAFVDYLKVLDDKFLDGMKAVRGDNGSDAQIKPTRGDILQNFTLFRNYLSALTKKYKGDKTKLRFLTERANRLNEIIKSVNEAKEKFKVIDTKTGNIIDSDLPKNIAQKLAKKKKEWTSYPDRKESAIAKIAQTLEEKNDTYFKAAYEAAEYAKEMAEKKGYQIDGDDWQTQIGFGGKYGRLRPGVGKTHSFSVGLTKNGKPQRKALNISLYGMDRGYELTYYIN